MKTVLLFVLLVSLAVPVALLSPNRFGSGRGGGYSSPVDAEGRALRTSSGIECWQITR